MEIIIVQCILDPLFESYNYKHISNPKARDTLIEMVETYNMIDPFRDKYSILKRYTWRKIDTRYNLFIRKSIKDIRNTIE